MSQIITKRWYRLPSTMRCLLIQNYGKTIEDLECQKIAPCPSEKQLKPDQALVKVHAASINPFDIEMSQGYGRNTLNVVRRRANQPQELPLILGRDFSGTIVKTGRLFKRYTEGDGVYGVRWIVGQGTHAQYVVVNKTEISPKPGNLSHVEAATLPYVACTTWSALINSGAVPINGSRKLRIFIPGGTGGIGSFGIQLCQAFGHDVVTSCAPDGMPLLNSISINNVLDYTQDTYENDLKDSGPFDVILDTQNEKFFQLYKTVLKESRSSHYVSLRPTLLPDVDKHGLYLGLFNSAGNYLKKTMDQCSTGKGLYQWGFFSPDGIILDRIKPLVESGQIKPLVDKVFKLDDILDGYRYVEAGHARGKTIIEM